MEYTSDVGEKIKMIRCKLDLSQERFGMKIGVTGKAISAYETGRAQPPIKIVKAIAEVFNTPILYLNDSEKMKLKESILKIKTFVEEIESVVSS